MAGPNRSARTRKLAPTKADRDFVLVRQRTNSAEAKARQSSKIRELGDVLVSAGFNTLDRQASALGLSRSTAWTVLRGHHKNSGLSATIINRILCAPELPPLVRVKLVEYVKEKATGLYGHNKTQRKRFVARLSADRGGYSPTLLSAQTTTLDREALAAQVSALINTRSYARQFRDN